jgi:ribosomal protein S12 methylthiotransferase
LGCAKNLVDSEKMLGLLAEAGCAIVGEGAGPADVLVVNTCGFLSTARDEALAVLREAARQKRRGAIRRLVVAGCLVQRDGEKLMEAIPEIDAIVGVNDRASLVEAVVARRQNVKTSKRQNQSDPELVQVTTSRRLDGKGVFVRAYRPGEWTGENRSDRARLRLTPPHYAYLRISEGCDQKCTFCTIPFIRGPMHSKTVEEILAEARELIEDGCVELNLIGQDTTSYGRDIGYGPGLAGLLRALNGLDGVAWIRLMYAYPTEFSDEMIGALAECERVVKYVDLPLQHISDRVLRAMHRRVTRQETEALLAKLRRRMPGAAIRTTFIAGFPGETEAEFEELRRFVREFEFDAVGVFAYSNEEGTPAFRMKEQVPAEVIRARVEALMLAQQEIAFRKAAARQGARLRVLIDGVGPDGHFVGRHAGQAPEVDSVTYVRGRRLTPGRFIDVRCVGSKGYDLVTTA